MAHSQMPGQFGSPRLTDPVAFDDLLASDAEAETGSDMSGQVGVVRIYSCDQIDPLTGLAQPAHGIHHFPALF